MQSFIRRWIALAAGLVLFSSAALAQTSYFVTNLTSDINNKTKNTDPLLANPWGLAYAPGAPFWISDEASGWSTLYNAQGVAQSLQVVVPTAAGTGFGSPTGIVFNGSQEFAIDSWVSVFLFATLDGSIQGWSSFNPGSTLVAASQSGASYTGLAITNYSTGNFIYAADAANNKVDVYDGNFNLVTSFTDPTVPAGFSPFGIQDIGGQVYVAYAAESGGPGGYIDIFSESGTFVKRFAEGKPLNQPWGMAVAPKNFGPMSNAFLVTDNITYGSVNAFNATTGKFMGALKNAEGNALVINGIWGIEFGGGTANNGQTNQLFFTAGPNDEKGNFGYIGVH